MNSFDGEYQSLYVPAPVLCRQPMLLIYIHGDGSRMNLGRKSQRFISTASCMYLQRGVQRGFHMSGKEGALGRSHPCQLVNASMFERNSYVDQEGWENDPSTVQVKL